MCGISGVFSLDERRVLNADVVAMTSEIRHRGPDDEGYVFFSDDGAVDVVGGEDTSPLVWQSQHPYTPRGRAIQTQQSLAALGHRRLSILDLSPAGHQPMCTPDRRYWIVFNGEIYNYVEVRAALECLGYQFHSHGDTEVILNAYRQWGAECLHRMNGMFAFVIYDSVGKSLLAARDRFGVKPLYYWLSPAGLLAFGSEIKQFLGLPAFQAKVCSQRAYDYLVWGALDHTDETLFQGVRQLRGGECMTCRLSEGLPQIHRWYSLPERCFSGTFQEAAKRTQDLLQDAVTLRLRADVEVGSCLSGGLDSSSIVCLMSQGLGDKGAKDRQRTFSACWHDNPCDERKWVDTVVRHCGVEAHYCYPTVDSLVDDCRTLTFHQDEPFGSTSIFAQYEVFRLARSQNVKVMLDGQGADELLGGYHPLFGNHFYDLFRNLQWGRLVREMHGVGTLHPTAKPLQLLMNQLLPEIVRQPLRALAGKPTVKPRWLNLQALQAEDVCPFPRQAKTYHEQSQLLLTRSSVPMLLHWEDRNSMAHSVESRTPFLDFRLVEHLMSLPVGYCLDRGVTKKVLRQGMSGILPDAIRDRYDKVGFATPEEQWMRREHPQEFRALVDRAVAISGGIFVEKQVHDMVDRIIVGRAPFNFLVWRIINFGLWMERFLVKS